MVGRGDSTSTTPCSDPPGAVSVSGGLNPTITWAAECEAQEVTVYDANTGFAVWAPHRQHSQYPETGCLIGVVPAGAKALHAAEPLQRGTGYGVYVAALVGTDTSASVGTFTLIALGEIAVAERPPRTHTRVITFLAIVNLLVVVYSLIPMK